jgi:thiol-disulfide isomerase/thioredoxin
MDAMRNIMGVFVVLSCLATSGCDQQPPPTEPPVEPQVSVGVGTPGGAVGGRSASTTESLPRIDVSGIHSPVKETADSDRVLVIDFWATWCAPCVELFDPLHAELGKLGDRVRLVSVTLDGSKSEAAAVAFLKKHHALKDAWIIPDGSTQEAVVDAFADRWQNVAVPAILVFDQKGSLIGQFLDADARLEPIVSAVRGLVESPSKDATP